MVPADILDVLIVGGGPAGLATAIRARLAGMRVLVLERFQPPVDKACGEGLMPDAVARLHEIGVELPPGQGVPFRGIRYFDGDLMAEGVFPGCANVGFHEPRAKGPFPLGGGGLEQGEGQDGGGLSKGDLDGGRPHLDPPPVPTLPPPEGGRPLPARGLGFASPQYCGLGVRRLHLHEALTRRAGEVGVEIHWGRGVRGLVPGGVETDDGPVLARWVVGADGLHSRVRSWANLDAGAGPLHRFGVRRHYSLPPWSDFVEVYWSSGSPGCEAYVTPVTPDEIGVALLWSGGKSRFDDLLQRFPTLRDRLAGAPVASKDRGAGPLHQKVRGVCRGNVALVGDAAGYLDAITGEGLAVALHQSAALVEALRAGDLSLYAAAHRRIARLPDFMTSLVLSLERRPGLRRRAVKALAAEPALFSRLLGIHGRTLPPRRLGLDGALRLAWRLVAA